MNKTDLLSDLHIELTGVNRAGKVITLPTKEETKLRNNRKILKKIFKKSGKGENIRSEVDELERDISGLQRTQPSSMQIITTTNRWTIQNDC